MTKSEAKKIIEMFSDQLSDKEVIIKKILEIIDLIDDSTNSFTPGTITPNTTWPSTNPYDTWPKIVYDCNRWDKAPGEHYPRDYYGGYTFYCNAANESGHAPGNPCTITCNDTNHMHEVKSSTTTDK